MPESTTTAQAQLAVYRAAQGKADADALLDSQSFNNAIKDVDLTDAKAVTTLETSPTPAPNSPADQSTHDGLPDDPDQLKTIIRRLRGENAKARTDAKAKAAEDARNTLVQDLGKALGLITDKDQAPTVEDLTQSLTHAQEEAHAAQAQLAVYRAAQGKADVDALLDSQSFNNAIKDVDLTDAKAVTSMIDAFLADHPRFKPAQVAGASSVEHPAGSGEGTISLDQFKAMTGEQRNRLYATNPALYRQLADKA